MNPSVNLIKRSFAAETDKAALKAARKWEKERIEEGYETQFFIKDPRDSVNSYDVTMLKINSS